MKRFWRHTSWQEVDSGFVILLDDKPLKTAGRDALHIPFQPLAAAIAHEWQIAGVAGGEIMPQDLPLTQLITTNHERVRQHRQEIIRQLTAYGLNDLLCYRANFPAALVEREQAYWQPWLDWAAKTYGISLNTGNGVAPVQQPDNAGERFTTALNAFDDFHITALGVAVPALGSLILGLALVTGLLDADTALDLSMLDETFQAEQWGEDNGMAKRREAIRNDLVNCCHFLGLCQP